MAPEVPWDERSVLVIGHELSLRAGAPADGWRRLLGALGGSEAAFTSDLGETFNVVGKESSGLMVSLHLWVHAAPQSKAKESDQLETHWSFTLTRTAPKKPAEEQFRDDVRVGDYPGILERLRTHWPADAMVRTRAQTSYLIDTTALRLLLPKPRNARPRIKVGTGTGQLRARFQLWDLVTKQGNEGVHDLSLSLPPQGEGAMILGSGVFQLEVGPTMFQAADEKTWEIVSQVVARRASE